MQTHRNWHVTIWDHTGAPYRTGVYATQDAAFQIFLKWRQQYPHRTVTMKMKTTPAD